LKSWRGVGQKYGRVAETRGRAKAGRVQSPTRRETKNKKRRVMKSEERSPGTGRAKREKKKKAYGCQKEVALDHHQDRATEKTHRPLNGKKRPQEGNGSGVNRMKKPALM